MEGWRRVISTGVPLKSLTRTIGGEIGKEEEKLDSSLVMLLRGRDCQSNIPVSCTSPGVHHRLTHGAHTPSALHTSAARYDTQGKPVKRSEEAIKNSLSKSLVGQVKSRL